MIGSRGHRCMSLCCIALVLVLIMILEENKQPFLPLIMDCLIFSTSTFLDVGCTPNSCATL